MKSLLGGIVLGLALVAVMGWPALATVRASLGEGSTVTGGGLMDAFGPSGVARPLGLAWNTARLVLETEAIALPLGLPLALLTFRTDLWGRRVLLGLFALAVFVPTPLHAIAWLGAFGNPGRLQALGSRPWLVGFHGAAFVHAMAALPWIVLLAGMGLRSVEPELEEAALLDQPAWRVLAGTTLRRSLGAIAGAALAVAVLTAGDMTVTDLLQVRTYAEEAYVQYQVGNGPGAAAAVTLPPLVVLGAGVLLAAWALQNADPARIPSAASRAKVWRLGPWRIFAGALVLLTAGNAVALPLYGLIWRAGRVGGAAAAGQGPHWSLAGLGGTLQLAWEDVSGPLAKSILLATLGAWTTVALAWPMAWSARRAGVWRLIVALAAALALATPGPVAGMALVLGYEAVPPIYDTAAIVVLGYVLRTLPYALLVLWPALRRVPEAYLESAAVDGYGPWGQVWHVALPATRDALLAAWGVAFALALGELPATNLVEPPSRTTLLAKRVWELLHIGVESRLAGVGLIMLAAIAAAGALAYWWLGRVYFSDRVG